MLVSCTPQGALSPDEAYYRLRAAFVHGNAEAVEKLLSENSQKRLGMIIAQLASLEEKRAIRIAQEMKIAPAEIKRLTIRKFISLQLQHERNETINFLQLLRSKPSHVSIKGNRAILINEAGVSFELVKEDIYWKFEKSFF
jgi:hypothetical protein